MLISCLLLHLHFHQMRKEKLSKRPEVLKDSLLVKQQCALLRQVPPTQSFTPAQLRERKFRSHLGIKKKIYQQDLPPSTAGQTHLFQICPIYKGND